MGKRSSRRLARKVKFREPFNRILIVCEGAQTEPNYFRSFKTEKDVIEIIGEGRNTESLVKRAIEYREEKVKDGVRYNQVWCVFDRNSFPERNFNAAFSLAKKNRIEVAYSNQCFEL